MGSLSDYLCAAIKDLSEQKYATSTIHKILFSFKDSMDITAAVLVVRNQENGKLQIKNRYNVSDTAVRSFYREIGSNLIGRIWYEEELIVTSSSGSDEDYKALYLENDFKTAITVRVASQDQTIGYISLYFDKEVEVDSESVTYLAANASICSCSLMKDQYSTMINSLRHTDEATGIFLYNYLHKKLKEELERSIRYKVPLSLAMVRIDDFVEIMQLCGTDISQKLYKEVADELKAQIRGVDVLGGVGKDELILYMPNTTSENAEIVLKRFQEKVGAIKFTEKDISIIVDIGITSLKSNDTLEAFINRVKVALHSAVKDGSSSLCLL